MHHCHETLQAVWYFGAAHILYEGRREWVTPGDAAPHAMAPVFFVAWMNGVVLGLVAREFPQRMLTHYGAVPLPPSSAAKNGAS